MTQEEKVNILVVDDKAENLLAMESLLESEQLNIVTANSGQEALACVLRYNFALVLLDVQMPDMDGFETAEIMRSRPKTRHIPIIFVTAISKEDRHVFKGYEAGAVDYLFKPVDPVILQSKVRTFVELYKKQVEVEHAAHKLEKLNANLERMVDEKTRALQSKAEELVQANHRLIELDKMKSAFVSSVSHELRTPLTSIMGFAKLIDKDFVRFCQALSCEDNILAKRFSRIHDNLQVIGNEGERLTRLINDVLDLNKIESGRVDWRDEETHPGRVINMAMQALRMQFEKKPSVDFVLDVSADLPVICVDRDKLEQVLLNLLHNAEKFTQKGRVTLSAAIVEGELRVCVQDTGEGIPEEYHAKIFDKFLQVKGDTLSNKPKGTGLGLAICKQIIEHYHGRIWVESKVDEGSSFYFTLPLKPGDQSLRS